MGIVPGLTMELLDHGERAGKTKPSIGNAGGEQRCEKARVNIIKILSLLGLVRADSSGVTVGCPGSITFYTVAVTTNGVLLLEVIRQA